MTDGSGGACPRCWTAGLLAAVVTVLLLWVIAGGFAAGAAPDDPGRSETGGDSAALETGPFPAEYGPLTADDGPLARPSFLTAQSATTRSIVPTATYLHTNGDDAADAVAFSVFELGAEPGETIRIERLGDFENGGELRYGLTAVFSTNATLLAPDARHRVPGAVDAGADVTTAPTYDGSEPTDIPEDFRISSNDGSTNATTVTVPEGGFYLFVSPQDNLFEDNLDTDEDLAIAVTVVNEAPTAALDVSDTQPNAGEPVRFDATNSSDPDGTIESYRWDFDGDGTVDRTTGAPATNYTFHTQDAHVASVEVVDDDGATARTSMDLSVGPHVPVAACTARPSAAVVGQPVELDASASSYADSYRWDLDGDGTLDTDNYADPVFETTYDAPGTYAPAVEARRDGVEATDRAPCGEVTVTTEGDDGQPPTARFTPSPVQATAGAQVTFDAAASSDPDGSIASYRWDFDGDGTVDATVSDPTTTYRYSQGGSYVPELTVVDDEGQSARTTRDVVVEGGEPTCWVEPGDVAVGEAVTIGAAHPDGIEVVSVDVDGDGEFERSDETDYRIDWRYETAGSYAPQAEIVAGPETTVLVDCGTVDVGDGGGGAENLPPRADIDHSPLTGTPNETVTFDASNSRDRDGRIVEYRWDFGADGTIDRTTTTPYVNHTFADAGNYTVRVTVVDDDGATDSDEDRVPVDGSGGDGGFPIPITELVWLLPGAAGGGAAGYGACRGGWRPDLDLFGGGKLGGSSEDGVTGMATGTIRTPPGGGSVAVTDLDFEPDVVRFRTTNGAAAPGTDPPARSTGWSYGVAARTANGLEQQVVSVADDAASTTGTAGAAQQGKAIDLLVHGEERVGSLAGTVAKTTEDGFVVDFDAETLPPAAADDSYVVLFDAMETASDAVVDVGHVTAPAEPGVQTVDLDVDADHVALTATTLPGRMNAAGTTDRSIGFSTGRASARGLGAGAIAQTAAGYVASSSLAWPEAAGVYDDRALALAHADEDGIVGRTRASVTGLGEELELTYDAVHVPDDAVAESAPTATGGDGDPAPEAAEDVESDPETAASPAPAVVTYVAIDTEGRPPRTGVVHPPADDALTSVDLGFRPGHVEFQTFVHAGLGTELVRPPGAAGFEWSESSVVVDRSGSMASYLLHGSVDDGLPIADALAPPEPLPEDALGPTAAGAGPIGASAAAGPATGAGVAPSSVLGGTDSPTPAATGRGDSAGGAGEESADGPGAPPSEDDGTRDGSAGAPGAEDDSSGPDQVRAGVGLRSAAGGGLLGRTEVAITAITPMGMELRVTGGGSADADRPVCTYVAWPEQGQRGDD